MVPHPLLHLVLCKAERTQGTPGTWNIQTLPKGGEGEGPGIGAEQVGKGLDEQHLAQTISVVGVSRPLNNLVRHQILPSPFYNWSQRSRESKPSFAFCTLDTKVTLSAGDSWPVQCLFTWGTSLPLRHRGPCISLGHPGLPQAGRILFPDLQHHPHTNLDLHRVFLGPVPIIFLLAFHELPEMFLDQESSIEFAHCHLIIWREETKVMIVPVTRSQEAGAARP